MLVAGIVPWILRYRYDDLTYATVDGLRLRLLATPQILFQKILAVLKFKARALPDVHWKNDGSC